METSRLSVGLSPYHIAEETHTELEFKLADEHRHQPLLTFATPLWTLGVVFGSKLEAVPATGHLLGK